MQGERYCECGCGGLAPIADRDVPRKGWVVGQPKRFIHGHNQRKAVQYRVEDCGYETPCWVWLLGKTRLGYGSLRVGYDYRPAYRVYYERYVGPIPPGLHLDHLCRNPSCVNPEHLEPVTPAENTRRGLTAKITMEQAMQIRSLTDAGWRGCDIARAYDVSQQLVCDIKKGRKWVAP